MRIVSVPIFTPPVFRPILARMILIVEDNAQVRRMIRSFIADLDPDCCECEDGALAFAAYERLRPDWVLMDIQMRRMNGLAATRQIIARFPEARIVMVTSHDDARMRRMAREAGARDYVVKENLLELRRLLAH